MDTDAVLRGVNALLPPEIRVLQVEEVAPEFHARRSARSKTYQYHIWRERIVSPFHSRYVYPCSYSMNERAIDEATQHFIGTHDFTSYSAASSEVEDRVRTIFEAEWLRGPEEWIFSIKGSGFLQYMVRTIVGTLLYVGQGKLRADDIPRIFEAKDRRLAGPSAPPHGLHLMTVEY
jgi:tRNA pseudouridine38-40 synthase